MDAYIYQAALLCEECAEACREKMDREGNNPDCFPDGPYVDGGGESDSPEHCDCCHAFLENPLTTDGMEYVRSACLERDPTERNLATTVWAPFYGVSHV